MGRDEWFRRKTWTEQDRVDFFNHLKKARRTSSRAQYLRIQAHHLQEADKPSVALELLDYLFKEFPERAELAIAYLQKAQCLEVMGRVDEVIQAFQDSLKAERNYKNVRTDAPLDFGMFVIRHQRTELYGEAARALEEFPDLVTFPYQAYQYHAIQAVIAQARGDISEAREHAKQAILASTKDHSGFRYHAKVGLVKAVEPKIERMLKRISAA